MPIDDIQVFKHPGLNPKEFQRLIELDRKEIEGTMSAAEERERDALLAKVEEVSARSR